METNTLLYQFKQAVEDFSDQPAVCDDSRCVTYKEFNQHANRVAHQLRMHGVTKGSRVGILSSRSSWFIEGFMGILKLGAIYVPLDPNYPLARLKYMILSSGIQWILADAAVESILNALQAEDVFFKVLPLNTEISQKLASSIFVKTPSISEPLEDLWTETSGEDTAVILFTSGSTGEPKGVELPYAGYINNFSNMQSIFQFHFKTRIAHIASPCFDISLTELWMPLLYGATIYVASDETKKNPWLLATWIQKNQIDTIQFVPSLFHHFILVHEEVACQFPSITHLLLLGEALRTSLVQKWFASFANASCRVYNLYGPVEASIETTCYTMSRDTQMVGDSVPIGKPFKGVDFYIFDSKENLITGYEQDGQLFIGGLQLAKGYLNKEQTKKAFKEHPTFGRIYATGDIVKRLPSGDFVYLGRCDRQVKIRGFRIELTEIEEALGRCAGIKGSAVVADKSNEEVPLLLAFVTGTPHSVESIKEELIRKLPHFMIPHNILVIDSIPLNANGKTDYKALQTYV